MSKDELTELLAREIERIADEDPNGSCLSVARETVTDDLEVIHHPPIARIDGAIDCGKLAEAVLDRWRQAATIMDAGVTVDRKEMAAWCRRKAEFYKRMKQAAAGGDGTAWCQARLESFLETADMLDEHWPFDLDQGDGAVPRGTRVRPLE